MPAEFQCGLNASEICRVNCGAIRTQRYGTCISAISVAVNTQEPGLTGLREYTAVRVAISVSLLSVTTDIPYGAWMNTLRLVSFHTTEPGNSHRYLPFFQAYASICIRI